MVGALLGIMSCPINKTTHTSSDRMDVGVTRSDRIIHPGGDGGRRRGPAGGE